MTQYVLDCGAPSDHSSETNCSLSPYHVPPASVDHYALAPTWALFIPAVLLLAFIVSTAIVRFKRHGELGETNRQRILHPPPHCPTCGDLIQTQDA